MELYLVWKWPYCLQVTALWSTRLCLPSEVLTALSSAKYHQLFFFKCSFFASIDTSPQLCPLCGFWVGCLPKQESGVMVINKWVSTSYWQSQGAEDQVHLAKRNSPLQSSAKVWSILTPRPSSLPKFKEHRHLPFEAQPINIWTADRSHPVPTSPLRAA